MHSYVHTDGDHSLPNLISAEFPSKYFQYDMMCTITRFACTTQDSLAHVFGQHMPSFFRTVFAPEYHRIKKVPRLLRMSDAIFSTSPSAESVRYYFGKVPNTRPDMMRFNIISRRCVRSSRVNFQNAFTVCCLSSTSGTGIMMMMHWHAPKHPKRGWPRTMCRAVLSVRVCREPEFNFSASAASVQWFD